MPTLDCAMRINPAGGHGARKALLRREALPSPLPTLRDSRVWRSQPRRRDGAEFRRARHTFRPFPRKWHAFVICPQPTATDRVFSGSGERVLIACSSHQSGATRPSICSRGRGWFDHVLGNIQLPSWFVQVILISSAHPVSSTWIYWKTPLI